MKNTLIAIIFVLLIGGAVYFLLGPDSADIEDTDTSQDIATDTDTTASTTTDTLEQDDTKTVIATSVGGREVVAYHYGTGGNELLFVGGTHGGYSWNTALVAYNLMEYLEKNPAVIPANVRVTVIPVLNPDGLHAVVGTTTKNFSREDVPDATSERVAGRFNGNVVDLNRNFDCDWSAEAVWQKQKVSGGSAAFSEPEAKGLRDYILAHTPDAALVWYSASGGVFASSCHDGVMEETSALTKLYADASGYRAFQNFDFYAITGDMVNWMAKEKIPAISVLLTSHETVEWEKNKKGIDAMLKHYSGGGSE